MSLDYNRSVKPKSKEKNPHVPHTHILIKSTDTRTFIIRPRNPCTQSHNLLILTLQTYIWHAISRRVGQLAGIKLDPQVPHCSVGLKAILKASPTVLHQWESMDSGQAKQPGASRTPGGLHLFSVYTLASFMFKHDMSSHVPICQRYQTTRALTQHHGMLHISNKNQTNNYLTVCIRVLCGVYLCVMGECVFMHAKGHR